jgi:hypothetical protein
MVPIEEFDCDTIQQAHIREQHWIDTLQSNMNSRGSILDLKKRQANRKEWEAANRDSINIHRIEYNAANKEHINARQKIYRDNNPDKFIGYQKKKKEYNAANRDKINAYQREWRKKQKQSNEITN